MNVIEHYDTAYDQAVEQLVTGFDFEHEFPLAAASHSDLWPGDRWTEAYLAIDRPGIAEMSLRSILRSVRADGSIPHLMQGSHKRFFGIETNWIDRQIYKTQGNGAVRSASNEWVTAQTYSEPTWANGALALHEYLRESSEEDRAQQLADEIVPVLTRATECLYRARSNEVGLIMTASQDDLTGSTGNRMYDDPAEANPAVNASLVQNNEALHTLAEASGHSVSQYMALAADQTRASLLRTIEDQFDADRPRSLESIMAAARLGLNSALADQDLLSVYRAPSMDEKHPERNHLTMAECIELARLTQSRPESQAYLARICTAIALGHPITRFENAIPGKNPILNKLYRRQLWLPTAAELVLLADRKREGKRTTDV